MYSPLYSNTHTHTHASPHTCTTPQETTHTPQTTALASWSAQIHDKAALLAQMWAGVMAAITNTLINQILLFFLLPRSLHECLKGKKKVRYQKPDLRVETDLSCNADDVCHLVSFSRKFIRSVTLEQTRSKAWDNKVVIYLSGWCWWARIWNISLFFNPTLKYNSTRFSSFLNLTNLKWTTRFSLVPARTSEYSVLHKHLCPPPSSNWTSIVLLLNKALIDYPRAEVSNIRAAGQNRTAKSFNPAACLILKGYITELYFFA